MSNHTLQNTIICNVYGKMKNKKIILYITSFKNTNVDFQLIYKVREMAERYLA